LDRVETIVVGAGIVGVAIARALASSGREVVVLETESAAGTHTSSRNNEVVHAGFLYPPQSLRSRLCRRGRDLLLAYCRDRDLPTRKMGKLMPAVAKGEVARLGQLWRRAKECGVEDLTMLDRRSLARVEPSLCCDGALHSPSTAIVDTHALLLSLQADAEANSAVFAFSTQVIGASANSEMTLVRAISRGETAFEFACTEFVNAAGLGAHDLAQSIDGVDTARNPRVRYAKGSFFSYSGPAPFKHLIVPLGETLAMGGAFTLDLAGRGRFGGDLEWIADLDYRVDACRGSIFAQAIRRYWPELDPARLALDYAGIRPRCWGPTDTPGDWAILGPRDYRVPGLVQLFGIETPGLTACMAIGEYVRQLLDADFPK
jgi:L-2-hydroxyglutarate oxidase LhgO